MGILMLIMSILHDRRNKLRVHRRLLRDRTDPFKIPELRFIKLFRFNKQGAMDLLNELSPHMKNAVRKTYIPKHMRLCAALHFYATGSVFRDCGEDFRCPMSNEEISGLPGVIGAIDCAQVKLKKPSLDVEHCYLNREGFYTKKVQLICDADVNILGVLARYGGGCNDAHIWSRSRVKAFLEKQFFNGETNSWLVGDSDYPLQPWLMTPFANPDINGKQKYNESHMVARNCVERLHGVLRTVFGCLSSDRGLVVQPAYAGSIINACCTLHNIRWKYNLPTPSETEMLSQDGTNDVVNETCYLSRGRNIRETIVRDYFDN